MSHLGIETWRPRIEACVLEHELPLTVGAYLGAWSVQEINRLSVRLTAPIRSIDDLHHRAIELVQAETNFRGSNANWTLLGDLAMVITAAAARARFLELHASGKQAVIHRYGAT
jgi:hypothetical protein